MGQTRSSRMPASPSPADIRRLSSRCTRADAFDVSSLYFLEKIAVGRVAIADHGPTDVAGWSEGRSPDDWRESCALTRSRHLIDGNLSLDSVRAGRMAATAALGPLADISTHS
jgi:hypothetical protein